MERQLGRRLRGECRVAARCPCGQPAVIETFPLIDDVPFPTLYWLTCSRARRAVGALEASGRMDGINERLRTDEAFAAAYAEATEDYVGRRDSHVRLEGAGGIGGGASHHVKCLHAQLAHHLVCGCNPVGALVADEIGDVLHPPPCAT